MSSDCHCVAGDISLFKTAKIPTRRRTELKNESKGKRSNVTHLQKCNEERTKALFAWGRKARKPGGLKRGGGIEGRCKEREECRGGGSGKEGQEYCASVLEAARGRLRWLLVERFLGKGVEPWRAKREFGVNKNEDRPAYTAPFEPEGHRGENQLSWRGRGGRKHRVANHFKSTRICDRKTSGTKRAASLSVLRYNGEDSRIRENGGNLEM